jgi:energy-converting hydrogenase Eha subunit C
MIFVRYCDFCVAFVLQEGTKIIIFLFSLLMKVQKYAK